MSSPDSTSGTVKASKGERPSSGARMPSLNQLAARINLNSNAPSSSSSSSSNVRPRLAASLLRTGSSVSLASSAANSVADSTAVNPPSTRSISPAEITTPPRSTTPTPIGEETGELLTKENLEELEKETQKEEPQTLKKKEPKMPAGYKNIPSLDAITARLAKARTLSVDGTAKPPDAETIEDPKTPGLRIKAPEHPLEHTWTIYHDTKAPVPFTPASGTSNVTDPPSSAHPMAPDTESYEAGLTVVGEVDTVESFCRYFNWLKPPSKLERNSNYHLFKSGIKPMWEDEANANGGKWVLTMKQNPQLLDRCWMYLAMALIGEDMDEGEEICGAVVSLRSKVDRIQLWIRSKDPVEKVNGIGKKLVKLLDVSEADGIGFEFQYNNDDRPPPNKYISISALPQTSYRSTFPGKPGFTSPTDGSSGPQAQAQVQQAPSFSSFGLGGGGVLGGSGWRTKTQR